MAGSAPPRASRLPGIGAVAAGALASGAASAGGLALASHALGASDAAPLAVAWTLAVVVGPGLWWSVEQDAARRAAAGLRGPNAVAGLRGPNAVAGDAEPGVAVGRRAAAVAGTIVVVGLALRGRVF
ncbi:MAG TPA: hypothetical protein VHH09_03180, partial [Acidimicrobiales bacterium]|nr:hypothetical protein [Acidimicrobiales bacterium]